MFRFTKQADYGLIAVHYIASQQEGGSVTAKRIAEEYNIPPELLAKILQRLAKRGDRKSTRLNSSHIQKSRMPSSA